MKIHPFLKRTDNALVAYTKYCKKQLDLIKQTNPIEQNSPIQHALQQIKEVNKPLIYENSRGYFKILDRKGIIATIQQVFYRIFGYKQTNLEYFTNVILGSLQSQVGIEDLTFLEHAEAKDPNLEKLQAIIQTFPESGEKKRILDSIEAKQAASPKGSTLPGFAGVLPQGQ